MFDARHRGRIALLAAPLLWSGLTAFGATGTIGAHAQAASATGTGIVNAVSAEKRTINLSHDPIPALKWPAMTMDMAVSAAVDLARLRPGTKVRFTIGRGPGGLYVVDGVTPLP